MKNRRLYKEWSENLRDLFSGSPLLILRFIFCLSLFSSIACSAQNDSVKNKSPYELNDPRNPDCPCHKLQKQAEDEFALLNKQKENLNPVNFDNNIGNEIQRQDNSITNSMNTEFKILKTASASRNRFKKKRKGGFIFKLQNRYFSKRAKGYRFKFHTSDCFHW